MGNNQRTLTYQQPTPLPLPDGTVVTQGELKPVWQYIEKELGFDINDVAVQDQKTLQMIDIAASTGFDQAVIFGGASNCTPTLMNYGTQGYLINILDYIDQMPNFKAFAEANPDILAAITAADGGVYHLPYAAEIDNYARVFVGRDAWVTSLLDSTSALENETTTLAVAYEGYWNRQSTNVVDLQNAAASGGKLTQATALRVLKDYIASTYPEYKNPSELYVGANAQYDIDELVALWRVMKLSPRTLSKVSTGSVVEDAIISPFFTRYSRYREDALRLLNYFEGERVHSGDSFQARLYADDEGMHYSYAEESFLAKAENLRNLYSEGLIHSEFSDLTLKDNFRTKMAFSDDVEGQRQFGFMTYDWIASTTKGSEKMQVILPPLTTLPKAGINDFVHYVENTRAIKSEGWSISAKASPEELKSALTLFDYFYSPEGNELNNYSLPSCIEEDETYLGPDGATYPKLNEWIFENANTYKNGDTASFARDFLGALLPIGYQKEIGMEYQTTSESGFEGWALYNNANVLMPSYDSTGYMKLMPPSIPLTEQEIARIGQTSIGSDSESGDLFLYIISDPSGPATPEALREKYEAMGLKNYLNIYNGAYNRMMGK